MQSLVLPVWIVFVFLNSSCIRERAFPPPVLFQVMERAIQAETDFGSERLAEMFLHLLGTSAEDIRSSADSFDKRAGHGEHKN